MRTTFILRKFYFFVILFLISLRNINDCLFISTGNTVGGYDFVVNTVWPEVVANIEARTSSIFAPGNPNVFHEVMFLIRGYEMLTAIRM